MNAWVSNSDSEDEKENKKEKKYHATEHRR
jgi:hypothetical protein